MSEREEVEAAEGTGAAPLGRRPSLMAPRGWEHARSVLEFEQVMAHVAGRATSEPGRAAVLKLEPGSNLDFARAELDRVSAVLDLLGSDTGPEVPVVPQAARALARLDTDGAVLEPTDLRSVGVLLESSRRLRRDLGTAPPALRPLVERLHVDEKTEARIHRTVDDQGAVLDTASKGLASVRRELRRKRSAVVRALEAYMQSLPERWRVADASVSIRAGRYVIPVRREARSSVGGMVHDESASGGTLFVEPGNAVERMNRLRELELEDAREVHRVLLEISRALRTAAASLRGSWEALIDFDSLVARARTAVAWRGTVPELLAGETDAFEIVGGRHPLLLETATDVVPFDLSLDSHERTMVVSGPNTGGKTVLLKAIGLIPALAQAGVVPPVAAGTRLPLFTGVYADIGDEQSIVQSLSTFSAHLANLLHIVRDADDGSLVLVDEMGTGTDPSEGAALAQAIVESLTARKARTVLTSHMGQLKRLDAPGSGIVNASLQFDPDRVVPTFRLVKGRPGRSYGLAIARRLEFPDELLARAEILRSEQDARTEEMLARLEREEREVRDLTEEARAERDRLAALRAELETRASALADRERTSERDTRERARQLLLEARQEVEAALREARAAGVEDADSHRAARRRVEEAVDRHRSPELETTGAVVGVSEDLSPGDPVRVGAAGGRGTLVSIEGGRATVELHGGLRVKVAAGDLIRLPNADVERRPRLGGWTGPSVDASSEVDLRGLRLDEVEAPLRRALDEAVLGDLPSLRVIHGKGTGALRERVGRILAQDPRVEQYRPGGDGEGGTGVTVVKLR